MPFIRRAGRPGLLGLAARTAVVAGTATAVTGGMRARQDERAQQQYEAEQFQAQQQQAATDAAARQAAAQAAPEAPAPAGDDLLGRLQQLGALHAQGVLTDEEFSAAKAKLLA